MAVFSEPRIGSSYTCAEYIGSSNSQTAAYKGVPVAVTTVAATSGAESIRLDFQGAGGLPWKEYGAGDSRIIGRDSRWLPHLPACAVCD